jgi:aspartyl-tRNA(Asn)/glutamyl-tRNA(Gln) amidotransferase subunit B
VQETRHWNEQEGRTYGMRTKEGSSDYRYFPEPDLLPIAPTDEQRASVRGSLPELPAARRARLVAEWGISEPDARVLLGAPGLADYAEAAAAALSSGTERDVVNWCTGSVLAHLNETGLSPEVLPLAPDGLAELVGLVAGGTISRNQAKDVLDEALREPKRPKQIVAERGLAQVSDEGALAEVVDTVLAEHPDVVAEYRSGDDKAKKKKRGFLMGEAIKATQGQGNPQLLNRLLDDRLG